MDIVNRVENDDEADIDNIKNPPADQNMEIDDDAEDDHDDEESSDDDTEYYEDPD